MASKHEPCKTCIHRTLTMSLCSESELKGLEMSSEDKSGFLSLLFVSAQNPLWKFVWRQSFILKQTVKLTDIKRSFFHIALTSFQTTDLWQSEVFRLRTKLWGTSIKYNFLLKGARSLKSGRQHLCKQLRWHWGLTVLSSRCPWDGYYLTLQHFLLNSTVISSALPWVGCGGC